MTLNLKENDYLHTPLIENSKRIQPTKSCGNLANLSNDNQKQGILIFVKIHFCCENMERIRHQY